MSLATIKTGTNSQESLYNEEIQFPDEIEKIRCSVRALKLLFREHETVIDIIIEKSHTERESLIGVQEFLGIQNRTEETLMKLETRMRMYRLISNALSTTSDGASAPRPIIV